MTQSYKYFAFISYNSHDTAWGKRVQKKLESYRLPATLCNEHGWRRKPIKPVFFAPTDIQPGGLSSELQDRLRASRNLIVICSPHSAKSEWVGREIAFFHSLGRTSHIHFFIVEGCPHSGNPDTECFNPVVEKLGLPEILGANIHEKVYRWPWLNKERAYVQLVTKLLGVEFDTLWQRHKRMLVRKAVGWSIGLLAVLAALVGVWISNQPVDIGVKLKEASVHNNALPPMKDAIVRLSLGQEEVKADTIEGIQSSALFVNIPHHFLGKRVNISVRCKDWQDVDTTVVLDKHVTINIKRDESVYGNVRFTLWSVTAEKPVPDAKLTIEGIPATSDGKGVVRLFVPLDKQKPRYKAETSLRLESDSIFMPCGENDVLTVD